MDSENPEAGQGLETSQEKIEAKATEPLISQHEVEETKSETLSTQKQASSTLSPVKNLLLPGL